MGDRKGQYSLPVKDRLRMLFEWSKHAEGLVVPALMDLCLLDEYLAMKPWQNGSL
jgi:hypothetical protein